MKRLQRLLSMLLVICFTNATMFQVAQAALVTTEQVAGISSASGNDASPHERLSALMARSDVQSELERLGLTPDLAKARIAALTDEEATMLAQQIENAPAGGNDVLGVVVFVFLVLLITDILGFTKIFPFTRSVR
ncbi:PA2779 family protein [Aromatoleum sp.]|uniref:PA2779 family protein n=1 Tax=Aromatoleum sp. TaxID=2307007 RepID=UPI002FCCB827